MGGQGSGRKPDPLKNMFGANQPQPTGNAAMYIPNYSGVKAEALRTSDVDIVSGSVEGTAVKSTGETGGTKYLREDGDGTCSWQVPAGSGDVSKVGTPVNNQVGVWTGDGTIEGDSDLTFDGSNLTVGGNVVVGGTVDGVDVAARDHNAITLNASATTGGLSLSTQEISHRAATNAQTGYATAAHITAIEANTSASHTQGTDTALGSGAVAADHGTAATDQIVNVCYGTGAPPTANTTTIGSLFIQYTA
jgi:hypothetical protein